MFATVFFVFINCPPCWREAGLCVWPQHFTICEKSLICFGIMLYWIGLSFLRPPFVSKCLSTAYCYTCHTCSHCPRSKMPPPVPKIYSFRNMIIRKVLMDRIVLLVSFFVFVFFLCQWLSFCTVRFKKFKWIKLSCTYI